MGLVLGGTEAAEQGCLGWPISLLSLCLRNLEFDIFVYRGYF